MSANGRSRARLIVVGVDASDGANAALRWALEEARLRPTRLRAVHAWTLSYLRGEGYSYLVAPLATVPYAGLSDQRQAAAQVLERAIARAGPHESGADIERHVNEGPAGEVLVEAASEADLLVVGSRGHGGFVGLLLGSVGQHCVHHAPCPVVVVPN
jgi:nucleotide-binding universal stress UspA family protein